MDKLIKLLHEGNYSCVIKNKEISTFTQRGITDLYDLLNTDPAFLRGAQIADKVIKFKNGRVESIQSNDQPLSVEAIEW